MTEIPANQSASPWPSQRLTRIAIAVVDREGSFLVGVRPNGVPLAGYWEFPGGKVGDGESLAEAASRECLEETGLAVSIGRLLCRSVHEYEHGGLELHFFAAVPADPHQQPRPPFRWVTRQELQTLRFPPANADILAILGVAEP